MAGASIDNTFGAILIGAFVTMAVYGITTLQTYLYYLYYPKDNIGTKALVACIWLLDTLHVTLMCHANYTYLIHGFVDQKLHVNGTWSLFLSIGINVLIAFLVQCFFTRRIHHLSPERYQKWITAVISFFVLIHFVFGIETVIFFFLKSRFDRLQEALYQSALPFAITAVLSDIIIATALCVLLGSSRTEFEDTNSIITKIIIYAINHCILTCAVAIVEVIVFVAMPDSFYTFGLDFIFGKLYANSFLASLNSRKSLSGRYGPSTGDMSTSMDLGPIHSDHGGDVVRVPGRRRVRSQDFGFNRTASSPTHVGFDRDTKSFA